MKIKKTNYTLIVCWLFFGAYELYGQNNIQGTQGLETFRRRINIVRNMHDRLEISPKVKKQEIAKINISEYERLNIRPTDSGFTVFEYFKARQYLILGNREQTKVIARKLVSSKSVSPEAILLLIEVNAQDRKVCIPYERLLGKVLPLSTWRRQSDSADSYDPNAVLYLFDPSKKNPPSIPAYRPKKFFEIADRFFEMRLFDRAANAYRDTIYGFLYAPWVSNPTMDETWLSIQAGKYWLKIAESEWELGNHTVATDYLGKAGIYGSENQYKKANELLDIWSNLQPQTLTPEPNETELAQSLEHIARLYSEVNLHPRSIEIVETYSSIIGENKTQAIKDDLTEKWQVLLDEYCAIRTGKVILFGTDVLPIQNRLNVKIPKVCNEENLKEAKSFIDKQQN